MTAAFAELLVKEGNPHDYITLLDRLVDDVDRLFDGLFGSDSPEDPFLQIS